ncbi:MAG TPA: N-acetylmuramoyl-L-alanine amidase [Anseongella sp.]
MKRILCVFVLITFFTSPGNATPPADTVDAETRNETTSGYTINTVVLDAGHGGKDPGTQWGGVREKDVALSIVLKLGKKIRENMPGVKVIYTRDDDTFVELYERARIANRNKADLLICVHVNANPDTRPYGIETYTLGLHKSQTNFEVAKRENQAILLEENYKENYENFDPNSTESYIIFSLYQSQYMERSVSLAAKLQQEFVKLGRRNRGVKQAGFILLHQATMPAVYIETGFVSNPDERRFLSSQEGQEKLAASIYNAFKSYKVNLESLN